MPATKRPAPVRLALPKTFRPTDGERAVATRLFRVMRQRDHRGFYWLGPFIELLLHMDATDTNLSYINPARVLEMIKEIGPCGLLENGPNFIKAAKRKYPELSFVSGTSPHVATPGDSWLAEMVPANEEDQFYQILRLWRKEYPEPPKRREFPKGRTQHESDPDSD